MEIKYRKAELQALMHRLDPALRELAAQRSGGGGGAQVEAAMRAREEQLLPAYHGVALRFAEMHDTPVRAAACRCAFFGVLCGDVRWRMCSCL